MATSLPYGLVTPPAYLGASMTGTPTPVAYSVPPPQISKSSVLASQYGAPFGQSSYQVSPITPGTAPVISSTFGARSPGISPLAVAPAPVVTRSVEMPSGAQASHSYVTGSIPQPIGSTAVTQHSVTVHQPTSSPYQAAGSYKPSYQPTSTYQPTPTYQPTSTYQPTPTYQPTSTRYQQPSTSSYPAHLYGMSAAPDPTTLQGWPLNSGKQSPLADGANVVDSQPLVAQFQEAYPQAQAFEYNMPDNFGGSEDNVMNRAEYEEVMADAEEYQGGPLVEGVTYATDYPTPGLEGQHFPPYYKRGKQEPIRKKVKGCCE